MEQKIKEQILGAYKVLQEVIEGKDLRKLPFHYQEFITYIYLKICNYAELLDDNDEEITKAWAFACVVYQEMKWGLDDDGRRED